MQGGGDGLGSTLMRAAVDGEGEDRRWTVFDGPIDAIWIENMNTVRGWGESGLWWRSGAVASHLTLSLSLLPNLTLLSRPPAYPPTLGP